MTHGNIPVIPRVALSRMRESQTGRIPLQLSSHIPVFDIVCVNPRSLQECPGPNLRADSISMMGWYMYDERGGVGIEPVLRPWPADASHTRLEPGQ